jgi:diaminopimelate decarboxylase
MHLIMDLKRFSERRTPFYSYDTQLLQQTLTAIRDAIADAPHFHVHYAVKACATPGILRLIAAAGLGADCVSGGEVERAADCGFAPADIVFAGVGKSDQEINSALRLGISCFNVESLPELEVINELAAAQGTVANVAFRINPNVDAHTHAKITTGLNENKFGLAMEDMLPAIRRAQELPAVKYVGLHFHIGSQITELEPFENLVQRVNELQNVLDAEGILTEWINVGGGLGVNYAEPEEDPIPDFAGYFRVFKEKLALRPGQQVHFELGRAVVAQCGSLICRVLYVKHGHEKDFVIVDAGMTDLMRPALYGSTHEARNLSHPEAPIARFDIVGPICESSDVFLSDYNLPSPQRGDLIAFKSAGAYGEIMASCYNCRPLPASWID